PQALAPLDQPRDRRPQAPECPTSSQLAILHGWRTQPPRGKLREPTRVDSSIRQALPRSLHVYSLRFPPGIQKCSAYNFSTSVTTSFRDLDTKGSRPGFAASCTSVEISPDSLLQHIAIG